MARSVRDTRLDSRNARLGLSARREPYWRAIDRGAHIGYRRHKDGGGAWIARIRLEDKSYKFQQIGKADDIQDADGCTALSFSQAQEKARSWFSETKRLEAGIGRAGYTVDDALEEYLDYLRTHGKSAKRTEYSIKASIRPEFGDMEAADLTYRKIADWHKNMVKAKPRVRSGNNTPAYKDVDENDHDYLRKRKSSANRVLTILKAALNRAYEDGRVASDDAWRRVKPYRNVENAKIRYLTKKECERLVNVCPPEFRKLVQAAILTGCRYGEIIKMRVHDYNPDSGTIHIPDSKVFKARHVTLEKRGKLFFDQESAGKLGNDLFFMKTSPSSEKVMWGRSDQGRRLNEACEKAKIFPSIGFHILRHTHASQLAMAGVPMAVIAKQLGITVKTCEKHYAHLSPDYVSETIRQHFPDLDIVEASNVVSLQHIKPLNQN